MRPPYASILGTYPKGLVPTPKLLRDLDQFSSELVNGEDGGTWSPSAPIVIGPYHVESPTTEGTVNLTTGTSLLSGDVETVAGNSRGDEIDIPGLVLEGSSYPTFQTARGRTVVVPFTGWIEQESNQALTNPRSEFDETLFAPRITTSLSSTRIYSVPLPLRAQHRGCTIASAEFQVLVAGRFTSVPGTPQSVRLLKVGPGDVSASLASTGGSYDANGWLVDPAATVADFTNNGNPRTLTFNCNQNHTSIDPDSAFFMAQWRPWQFGGGITTGLGSLILSVKLTLTSLADLRQE